MIAFSMRSFAVLPAALVVASATPVMAQDLTEIEEPATELNEVLAHPVDLAGGSQEVRVVEATVAPRTSAGWHTHPTPVYLYITQGTLTMEVEGEETRRVSAGEALAEPLDARMRVRNEGDEPVRLVVFQISPADEEFLETER